MKGKRQAAVVALGTAIVDIALGVMFLVGWLKWLARDDSIHDVLTTEDPT